MQIEPPFSRRPSLMRARRGAVAAVTVLACAATASACGSSSSSSSTSTVGAKPVDTARVAASIEQSVLSERHLHVKVVCPPPQPSEPGKTFECLATGHSTKPPFAETKTPFVVTIQSTKGYVTYIGK